MTFTYSLNINNVTYHLLFLYYNPYKTIKQTPYAKKNLKTQHTHFGVTGMSLLNIRTPRSAILSLRLLWL